MTAAKTNDTRRSSRLAPPNRLFHFLTELRRRRVCRAITMYSVAMWLVCQIVDVISPALGLPEWTLRLVIVLGLLGLPIIIIMSWLLEITPDGLVVEGAEHSGGTASAEPVRAVDRVIDCSLILAALAIGVQLAFGAIGSEIEAAENHAQKIAVMPFRAAAGGEAERFSEAIPIELQHELSRRLGVTVISSNNPAQLKGSMKLTGVVWASDKSVWVAVTMTDYDSGVVDWSDIFEVRQTTTIATPADLAREIVAAMPIPTRAIPEPVKVAYVSRQAR